MPRAVRLSGNLRPTLRARDREVWLTPSAGLPQTEDCVARGTAAAQRRNEAKRGRAEPRSWPLRLGNSAYEVR